MKPSQPYPAASARAHWQKLAQSVPLVHCLTNDVAKNFTANVLLASGASPAMIEAEEECGAFTAAADSLLINIGTLHNGRLPGMRRAARTAAKNSKPWVLDPVAVGDLLTFRSDFARELLAFRPTVIRGNAAEILWLNGQSARLRGADSLSTAEEAAGAALELAQKQQCVVLVSGARDYITDGEVLWFNDGGDVRQTRVTACGCALSALVAAFCTVAPPLDAAASAAWLMKQAGSHAARAVGMGAFAVALLDALSYDAPFVHEVQS